MLPAQFALSWDSYKNNICSGFSSLQQSGELVDMTLAADGHFVKVHQVLLSLASPYLKELIISAPCQHPVVFLNNVSYTTLSLLLQYIYTGEVLIPENQISAFIATAKALHIKGLEAVSHEKEAFSSLSTVPQNDENELSFDSSIKRFASTKDSTGQVAVAGDCLRNTVMFAHYCLEAEICSAVVNSLITSRKVLLKDDQVPETSTNTSISPKSTKLFSSISSLKDDTHSYSELEDTGGGVVVDVDDDEYCPLSKKPYTLPSTVTPPTLDPSLQFTVSIRGSLQIILNRFMYNLISTQVSGVRRWRCIEYRNKKCLAFVVTKGNIILNRANAHCHFFHDQKILVKIQRNAVFSALDDAEGYREKEKNENQEQADIESEDLE